MPDKSLFRSIRAVIFDFEGTLVDFQWNLAGAVGEVLDALTARGYPSEMFGMYPGYAAIYNQALDMAAQGGGDGELAAVRRDMDRVYDRYDADAQERWSLHPDSLQTLAALEARGLRLGLASNIGRKALGASLDRLGLSAHLRVTVSRDEMERIKPHPQGLLQAAAGLEVSPADCLFVGDSANDVGAAHAAGMTACYLSGGEDRPGALAHDPPEVALSSLKGLTAALERA